MKKRSNSINKRGYLFLLDSIIALGVLIIGGFLVYASYAKVPSKEEPKLLSETTMNFFANTKISDTNNAYAGFNGQLWRQGNITNDDNTLLQQIGEFYAKNQLDTAEKFIANITENTIPVQYLFEFRMNNQLLYPRNSSQEHLNSKQSSSVLIPSRKLVSGYLNQETGDLYGPYAAEVLVWQK